jgi:hypothetical protein
MDIPRELIPLTLRSREDLHSLLSTNDDLDSYWLDYYAEWPEGFAVLFGHGYLPSFKALYRACEKQCVPSIKMILSCQDFSLGRDVLWLASAQRNSQIRGLIIQAFVHRRRRLQALAESHLSKTAYGAINFQPGVLFNYHAARACQLLAAEGLDLRGLEEQQAYSVYSTQQRGIDFWNELWDQGFCDVDETDLDGMTPLMLCAEIWPGLPPLHSMLQKAGWLISKGADLSRKGPRGPATHYLAEGMSYRVAPDHEGLSLSDQCISTFHTILLDSTCDDCNCACCPGGCIAFVKLLATVFHIITCLESYGTNALRCQYELSNVFENIASTLSVQDERTFYDWLAPRLLRYLTFCELDITHTCCLPRTELDQSRIDEIHYDEADSIAHLDLLVDEFLQGYSESSMTFHEFLREVWSPRMESILSEMPSDEEIAELRRLGVTPRAPPDGVSWRARLYPS